MVLLLLGAVAVQQLRRAQGIRNHHRHRGRAAARRELGDDLRMRVGGEFLAAVFLRDDHPEKALVLDELPDVRRQVLVDLRGLPVVRHGAELLGLVVEERELFGAQLRRGEGEELAPVRVAREQLAVPPHRSGLDRFALGLRHRRQDGPVPCEQRSRYEHAAQRRKAEQQRASDENRPEREEGVHPIRSGAEPGEERHRACGKPDPAGRVQKRERKRYGDDCDDPDSEGHGCSRMF